MKRIGQVLILAALAGSGCLPESFLQTDKKPPQVEMAPAVLPVVTADVIREDNAAEKAKALREELEHEMRPQKEHPPE
jgi:hypothetical protein